MQLQNINVVYSGQNFIGFGFVELPLEAARVAAAQQVDQAADMARRKVLGDSLRAVEYQLTATEAEAFAAAGHEGPVPATVQAWMDAVGKDAVSATSDILEQASAWKGALYDIRAARLKGKHQVLAATTHSEAEAIADQAIAQISASVQGVGNAL